MLLATSWTTAFRYPEAHTCFPLRNVEISGVPPLSCPFSIYLKRLSGDVIPTVGNLTKENSLVSNEIASTANLVPTFVEKSV
jgi:hypothetical protein